VTQSNDQVEIIDNRNQALPLSVDRIDWIANSACAGGVAYPHDVKVAIEIALREAAPALAQGFGSGSKYVHCTSCNAGSAVSHACAGAVLGEIAELWNRRAFPAVPDAAAVVVELAEIERLDREGPAARTRDQVVDRPSACPNSPDRFIP
jgi:hypothetical protein